MTFRLPSPLVREWDDVQRNFDGIAQTFPVDGQNTGLFRPPRTVTALPPAAQAFDGMDVFYEAAAGVTWHLKYKASEATYKWQYVGGPPLHSFVSTNETMADTANVATDLATPAKVNLPLAGDYTIDASLDARPSANAQCNLLVYTGDNGTGGSSLFSVVTYIGAVYGIPVHSVQRPTGIPAGYVRLRASTNANPVDWGNKYLSATPVRVI